MTVLSVRPVTPTKNANTAREGRAYKTVVTARMGGYVRGRRTASSPRGSATKKPRATAARAR